MEERARTYRAEGKFKEAVADLEAARKVLPEFISVLRELHDLYRTCPDRAVRNPAKAEEMKKAIEAWEQRYKKEKDQKKRPGSGDKVA